MKLGNVEASLHNAVMLIGLGGRFGSTPGLFVGIGFGNGCSLLFTYEDEFQTFRSTKEREKQLPDSGPPLYKP